MVYNRCEDAEEKRSFIPDCKIGKILRKEPYQKSELARNTALPLTTLISPG